MRMIPVDGLIALFRRMYTEHWPYVWGAAREGCVDCSGAFAWAYEQYGRSIAHGSNAIARQYVTELRPISEARPGMAAFKYYPPGHPKWNLPEKYRKGGSAYNGDLNDYYHVGLVDDPDTWVLNAQSTKTGFARSKISSGWGACGRLKAVAYTGGETQMQTMIVTSTDGNPVRVREKPSKSADVVAKLSVGTEVQAGDSADGWREITFGDAAGFMMDKFLKQPTPESDVVCTLTQQEHAELCRMRDQLTEAVQALQKIVGVG